jgi:hypothetical protein
MALASGHPPHLQELATAVLLEVEEDELETESREKVGDFVRWNSSGGIARGSIDEIKTEGSINVPDSDFRITA